MRSIANAVLLGILALLLSATLTTQDAQAATLDEFNSTCFTESGFEGTDGCFEAAESLGIEMDNLLSSIEQGCTQYFEDYSCKEGSSEPPSSSATPVSEQGTVTEQGCFVVDMKSDEVSGEDIDVLTQQYGFDVEAGNPDELLYSPECFEAGYVEWDNESMINNPCYDVLGNSSGDKWVEFIGCPSEQAPTSSAAWPTPQDADQAQNLEESKAKGCTPDNLFEDLSCKGPSYQGYTPITQQGTPAPADWRSHVTKVKPAALSTANPMVKGDTGVDVEAHNKRFEDSPAKKAAQRAENKAKAAKNVAQQSKSKKKK
jgi:hypothetical protein